jgi:hypothetical protein
LRTHGKQRRGDGQAYENSKKVKPGCDIIKEHVTQILVDACENRCRNGTMRASRSSELYLLFDSATTSSLNWKISHKAYPSGAPITRTDPGSVRVMRISAT